MNRRSLILSACVRAEFHTLLVVSVYLLFAGHNQPGGGFAGGLVAGAAATLRFAADGSEALRRSVPFEPFRVLGAGLCVALVAALGPLAFGGALFESASTELHLPLLGTAKVSSVLVFDTGVYLVVIGAVLLLLEQFGGTEASASHGDGGPR
ncbi:MAG: MnhB domain-containing protein [Microthrixaceae bacterium]